MGKIKTSQGTMKLSHAKKKNLVPHAKHMVEKLVMQGYRLNPKTASNFYKDQVTQHGDQKDVAAVQTTYRGTKKAGM
jgi:hypothetical protein